jgi:hypothetical protein
MRYRTYGKGHALKIGVGQLVSLNLCHIALQVPSLGSAYVCQCTYKLLLCCQTGLVLSGHLEEELLVEDRCENSRSKSGELREAIQRHGFGIYPRF